MIYKIYIKRLLDIFISASLLLLTLPVNFIVVIVLFLANKGSVFFIQERPGKDGKLFSIIKYKTMNDIKDADGNLLSDDERLSKTGKFVRSYSIDEIPQLINVLKGDLSLVGPRPLLKEYLSLYNDFQKRRHEVLPGITGWAQVNGRNAITWEKKFELDVWYVDNLSFLLDCRIIFYTIFKVLQKNDVSSPTSVTMEKFTGN
jgi:undecaprenyl phosphate N,N'-diacetylbacillosamine 1-phosphate transferase